MGGCVSSVCKGRQEAVDPFHIIAKRQHPEWTEGRIFEFLVCTVSPPHVQAHCRQLLGPRPGPIVAHWDDHLLLKAGIASLKEREAILFFRDRMLAAYAAAAKAQGGTTSPLNRSSLRTASPTYPVQTSGSHAASRDDSFSSAGMTSACEVGMLHKICERAVDEEERALAALEYWEAEQAARREQRAARRAARARARAAVSLSRVAAAGAAAAESLLTDSALIAEEEEGPQGEEGKTQSRRSRDIVSANGTGRAVSKGISHDGIDIHGAVVGHAARGVNETSLRHVAADSFDEHAYAACRQAQAQAQAKAQLPLETDEDEVGSSSTDDDAVADENTKGQDGSLADLDSSTISVQGGSGAGHDRAHGSIQRVSAPAVLHRNGSAPTFASAARSSPLAGQIAAAPASTAGGGRGKLSSWHRSLLGRRSFDKARPAAAAALITQPRAAAGNTRTGAYMVTGIRSGGGAGDAMDRYSTGMPSTAEARVEAWRASIARAHAPGSCLSDRGLNPGQGSMLSVPVSTHAAAPLSFPSSAAPEPDLEPEAEADVVTELASMAGKVVYDAQLAAA